MSVNAAFRTVHAARQKVHAAARAVHAAVGDVVRRAGTGRAAHGLAVLGAIAGLSAFGGGVGPGALANAADTPAPVAAASADAPAPADTSASADSAVASAAPVAMPTAAKIPSYEALLQPNAFYCGPAATRIALTAHGYGPSFDDLARALGTTPAGTASIFEVTRVLNDVYGYERYVSVELSHRGATDAQVEKLRDDVMKAINRGDPVVANIIGTVTDTAGEVHSYNGGHYVTITGYSDQGEIITVADPADRVGSNEYQVPLRVMADWISSRGYSA
ncbi:MAG: C39 family peptidase [Micromonosporaceae bacterium]|nr:C39 family peptidase [Micromonosporaceae bacterium]